MNPNIAELRKQIANLKRELSIQTSNLRNAIQDKTDALNNLCTQEVLHALKKQNFQFARDESGLLLGDWDCDKSPIGVCVYDLNSDLGDDDCLFCHEPDERK